MTLGRLVYLLYHRPVGRMKTCLREGGPIEQWKTEIGRREMEAAALRLRAIDSGHEAYDRETGGMTVEVNVLTGEKFWYQTAFCLYSLSKASGREVRAIIHDDGSLGQSKAQALLDLFPLSRLETHDMIVARLDELLPEAIFPVLRKRRLELPLIKKITDIHLGRTGWNLFMDADLLFFRRPDLLLQWQDGPQAPLTSVDVAYAYGYSMALLNDVAAQPVPELVNTGLLGLKSETIDWEKMEYWCRTLIDRAGTNYYQEQALVALQLAGMERFVLPAKDYLVYPQGAEAVAPRAVMHHYVDLSKREYFRHAWRQFDAN